MDNSVKCGNCRFCYTGVVNVYCRKKLTTGEGSTTQVKLDFWCGEFKRKFVHEESNRNLEPQKLVVRQCGNCIHYKGSLCTYNPPIKIVISSSSGTYFPSVSKEFSCSKFRAREIIIEEEPQNVLTTGKRAITFGDS